MLLRLESRQLWRGCANMSAPLKKSAVEGASEPMKMKSYRRVAGLGAWFLVVAAACSTDTGSGKNQPSDGTSGDDSTTTSTTSTAVSPSSSGTTGSAVTKNDSSSANTSGATNDGTTTPETLSHSSGDAASTTGSGTTSATVDSSGARSDTSSNGTSSDTTSGDVAYKTFVFTVSEGGMVRAFSLDSGEEPVQVADFEIGTANGDFFLTANPDASRVFVSYASSVMALAFDANSPAFTELDTASTAGAGTHVELSPDGEHVIVAHYNEGKVTHVGFDGNTFGATTEFAPGANAHSARIHPSGDWAYVPCLGSNHVAQFELGNTLTPNTPSSVPAAGGPRHMTFHPNGSLAYVLSELSGQAYTFAINADGTLGPDPLDVDEVASGVNQPSGSDVQITPDGKHLYTFIRRNQNLYHFDVASDGTLNASGQPTNFGQQVRAFAISPTGDVLMGGGSAGVLYTYSINAQTGALTAIGDGVGNLQSIQTTIIRHVPEVL